MASYERTGELRGGLGHCRSRRRWTGRVLGGQDANGAKADPMSVVEQEAFGRVAQLSASLIIKDRPRSHVERDFSTSFTC